MLCFPNKDNRWKIDYQKKILNKYPGGFKEEFDLTMAKMNKVMDQMEEILKKKKK